MPGRDEGHIPLKRFLELARRTQSSSGCCFSPFLSPPEARLAQQAANKAAVECMLFGGYPEAERQIAGFSVAPMIEQDFPVRALKLRWPHQTGPGHRDILGSVLGLGIQRQWVGDILVDKEKAVLFASETIARHIAANMTQAGRVSLQVELLAVLPAMEAAQGTPFRDTVSSLRLDALVASGLNLSRAKAVAVIETGHVKLRHVQTLRPDARVEEGDIISVRGMGRLQLSQVGKPTRKDRLPVILTRFGIGL